MVGGSERWRHAGELVMAGLGDRKMKSIQMREDKDQDGQIIGTENREFKASVVAFEVQKNFANKFFSNKTVAKSLIDDTSGNLLDNLYLLLYVFTENKKESEKTTRNIIKIAIKLAMLYRGEKFSPEDNSNLVEIQRNLRTVAKTLISFYLVDHSYDRNFVITYLTVLEALLKGLISAHLTDKSVGRVEQIFGVVKTPEFLDSVYLPKKNIEMREIMGKVVSDLNCCIEAGIL